MQEECQALLAARGFAQYEVSGYARAGRQCRHNLNYWRFGDYLGVGAGAHGKLSGDAIARSSHLREPRRYFATAGDGPEWRQVPAADLPFEFMMNALRLTEGFSIAQFTAGTAQPATTVEPLLADLASQGLLEDAAGVWRPTPRGFQFLNDVLQRFLPGANSPVAARS